MSDRAQIAALGAVEKVAASPRQLPREVVGLLEELQYCDYRKGDKVEGDLGAKLEELSFASAMILQDWRE